MAISKVAGDTFNNMRAWIYADQMRNRDAYGVHTTSEGFNKQHAIVKLLIPSTWRDLQADRAIAKVDKKDPQSRQKTIHQALILASLGAQADIMSRICMGKSADVAIEGWVRSTTDYARELAIGKIALPHKRLLDLPFKQAVELAAHETGAHERVTPLARALLGLTVQAVVEQRASAKLVLPEPGHPVDEFIPWQRPLPGQEG